MRAVVASLVIVCIAIVIAGRIRSTEPVQRSLTANDFGLALASEKLYQEEHREAETGTEIVSETTIEPASSFLPASDADFALRVSIIESHFYAHLAQMDGVNLISDISVSCNEIDCEMSFTLTQFADFQAEHRFWALLSDPPMDIEQHTILASREESGAWTYIISLSREEPNQAAGQEFFKQLARNALDSDDPFSPPRQIMGESVEGGVFVENVCSTDCPADTRQIIYIKVPSDRSCDSFRGEEKTLPVRTEAGGLAEREFCLLVDLDQ